MTDSEPLFTKSRLVFGAHLLVGLGLIALGAGRIYAFGSLGGGLINIGLGALVAYLGYRMSTLV